MGDRDNKLEAAQRHAQVEIARYLHKEFAKIAEMEKILPQSVIDAVGGAKTYQEAYDAALEGYQVKAKSLPGFVAPSGKDLVCLAGRRESLSSKQRRKDAESNNR